MSQILSAVLLTAASFVFTLNVILHLRLRRLHRHMIQAMEQMEASRALMHCIIGASLMEQHPERFKTNLGPKGANIH